MPWHGSDLSGIAQTAAARGEMVVELGDIVVPQHDASRGPAPQDTVSVHASLAAYLSGYDSYTACSTSTSEKLVLYGSKLIRKH